MARVPQYQPHQTGPATPNPARLASFDDGGGVLGGIIAGLPRLNKAVADWQAEDQRREVDARARTLAQALQSDVGAAMRGFAALGGQEAADAAPALKAQLLALQDAAREQANSPESSPDTGALFEQLSAGPMGRALDQLAEGARRGLRQMGGAAALGERDAAMAAGASAYADPEALLRHRRDMVEANARRAEAEEWDEKRFREEHGRSLSLFHRGVVQAAAEESDDLSAADAYLAAHRGEMGEKDILLTQELLQARHKLAASQQVVEQAIAEGQAAKIAAQKAATAHGPGAADTEGAIDEDYADENDFSFDIADTVKRINADSDLTAEQRRLATSQAYKRHSKEKILLSERHATGEQMLEQWFATPDNAPDQLTDLSEIPAHILRHLSPMRRTALEVEANENAARMELEAFGPANRPTSQITMAGTPAGGASRVANAEDKFDSKKLYKENSANHLNENNNTDQQNKPQNNSDDVPQSNYQNYGIPQDGFSQPFFTQDLQRMPSIKVTTQRTPNGKIKYTLTADIAVSISNNTNKAVDFNYLTNHLSRINTDSNIFDQNGNIYSIEIKFHEASTAENWLPSDSIHLTRNGDPYMRLRVVDHIPNALARLVVKEKKRPIEIDPREYRRFSTQLPHEIFHWLGLSHSAYSRSLMNPYNRVQATRIFDNEVINLIRGYMN